MTAHPKPRYPAAVFPLLRRYPVRRCEHCGNQLTPRYTLYQGKQHKLESVTTFETRRYCSTSCSARARARKLAEERNERIQEARERTAKRTEIGERQKRREISPPAPPAQDAVNTPSGLVVPEVQQSSPPGTPIPASFILQPELAKQGVTTTQQVETMTDDELLVLPRVSKAKLKMLRSQIAGFRKAALARTPQDDGSELLADEHKEPPTLTDPAYGGPPAPVEVAEEVVSEPSKDAEKPSMAEPGEPDPKTRRPGELQAGTALADLPSKMRKDPALNRPVRPVKLPSTTPPQLPPVPPPSLQAKLPDPRPQVAPYTVTEGEIIERADFGTCPNEGCGERLNAFGKCRNCEQRAQWLKGQRAKVGTA